MRDRVVHEGRGLFKDCEKCPDRALCDMVDSADIQFWPEEHRIKEVSRRLGESVSQTEYERVHGCLLGGRWVPIRTGCCGSAVTTTDDRVSGKSAVPSSITSQPDGKGGMNEMIRTFPSVLREKLGDDGARALIELLENAATARGAGESTTQDIQHYIDRALALLEFEIKAFVVTATCLLFLALSIVALQVGQAIRGT